MHRNWLNLMTRPGVSRLTAFAILGLLAPSLAATAADDPPKASTPPSIPVLMLSDGGFVAGSLDESTAPGIVRWKSPAFTIPLDFHLDFVQSIRFPSAEKLPRPTGSFGFELSGGDLVYGSLVGLDDKRAELDVARLGHLSIDRSRIRRIFRWNNGADLIYNGPNGLAGWKEIDPAKKPAANNKRNAQIAVFAAGNAAPAPKPPKPEGPPEPPWIEEGGQLQTTKDGVAIQANVELPVRSTLEIDLAWKQTPDFSLAIGLTDAPESVDKAFRLEVWEGQLVALRELETEADLVSLQPIADGPGRVQLQLFLDQEQGKLIIFSASGGLLGEVKTPGKPRPPASSLRLTNIKGDIRLERLRIGRWDGETPRPIGADLSRVQLTDLSIVRGIVEKFDSDKHEFVVKGESGEQRIAEDKVGNVFLAQGDDAPARNIRAVYQDGTRLGGDWIKAEGGSVVIDAPGIAGPLKLSMEGLRSLDVLKTDIHLRPKLDPTGTLEMDGVRLTGRLVDSGDSPIVAVLAWKPLLGESISPIRPGASGRIDYRPPAPSQPAQPQALRAQPNNVVGALINVFRPAAANQPAAKVVRDKRMIYLRTGDIIPAEILKIDEKGVTFRTELSLSSFVPHDRIKAVEMAAESPSSIKLNKTKFERLLMLPRMQRDSPPTQLIRSRNGDILRGRIIAMDDNVLRVEVRLEEKEIGRDRISRIIWLHPDEIDPKKKPAPLAETDLKNRVQAVRSDGIRLTYTADKFAEDTLSGQSDVLGECKVRMQDVDLLLIGGLVEKEATQLAYQNWKLQNAPQPKSAQDDDASASGLAGTESSLVGKPAPDFTLDLLDGKKFHLADHKGKVVVLDFWATWCGPCLQAMPLVEQATHEFADKGVELIAVNLQESPDQIKGLLERQKLNPTVALDRDGVVAQRYQANAIPQTVVIDREGKITRLYIGGNTKLGDQLKEALQALMPDPKP